MWIRSSCETGYLDIHLLFTLRVAELPNHLVMHSPGTSLRQISAECFERCHALPDHIEMLHLLTKLICEINMRLITPSIWPGMLMMFMLAFIDYRFPCSLIYLLLLHILFFLFTLIYFITSLFISVFIHVFSSKHIFFSFSCSLHIVLIYYIFRTSSNG